MPPVGIVTTYFFYHILKMKTQKKQALTGLLVVIAFSCIMWFNTTDLDHSPINRLLAFYLTSSSRSTASANVCSGFTINDFSADNQTAMSSYVDSLNSSLGIDGNALVRYIVDGNYSQAGTEMRNSSAFITFVVAFLVGLVVLILYSPFLLCCCACSYCCPLNCCNRKRPDIQFTKQDLQYPLFIMTFLLACAVIVCVVGLIMTAPTRESYRKATCTAAIVSDDLMNGNVTVGGGSYFMGINQIAVTLEQLRTNLTNIDNNITALYDSSPTTVMNQAISQSQNALSNTILISNNDASGSNLVLSYSTPLNTTTSTGSINSDFIGILGSYSATSGLVFDLYTSVYIFEKALSALQTASKDVHANLIEYNNGLNTAIANVTSIQSSVSGNINSFESNLQKGSDNIRGYEIGLLVYYIGLIVVALLGILVACCMQTNQIKCCRYILYFLCFLIFIGALFGFLLAVFYSLTTPALVWGCEYYNETISSQYGFQNNAGAFFDTKTTQQLGVCMPYGDGDLYKQIAGTTNASQLTNIQSIFDTLKTFDATAYVTPMFTAVNNVLTYTEDYALGKLMDISDSTALSVLISLATPTSGATNCNSNLNSDSWVPSNSQSNFSSFIINCTVSSGNTGTASTCASGLSSTTTCKGCMDSSEVLHRYLNIATSLPTDLSLRYGSICSFNTKLNNVWTKYYRTKLTALGPTVGATTSSTGVYPRAQTVRNDINTLNSTVIPALPNTFTAINNNLAGISALTDPVYGLVAGLNCSLVGEDAVRVRNTACVQSVDHMYLTRIIVGVISYILLVALIFIVCFGNRHARMVDEAFEGFPITNKGGIYIDRTPQRNEPSEEKGYSAGQLKNPYEISAPGENAKYYV